MFWYIGGVLAGFAIGYLVSQITRKPEKTGYRKGKRDCWNCKHTQSISCYGLVRCDVSENKFTTSCIPQYCARYEKIKEETP